MTSVNVFTLCLATLLLFTEAHGVKTFRLEAEKLPGPHNKNWRGDASGSQTVHVTDVNMQLTFPVCLNADVTVDVTVVYSNDGPTSDSVTLQFDDEIAGSFQTVAESHNGLLWNVFRKAIVSGVSAPRGLHRLVLAFPKLFEDGVEIDYVEVIVYDDFINDLVFRCTLQLAAEPQFSAHQAHGVENGYVEQRSNAITCAEEDNVHLAVYHQNVSRYTLKATHPLYRTFYNEISPDESTCPNMGTTYWQFLQINSKNTNGIINSTVPTNNSNNATVSVERLTNVSTFRVKFIIRFDLKGFSSGFIDADVHTDVTVRFSSVPPTGVFVKITYKSRRHPKMYDVLDEFQVNADATKKWEIPEMSWSEGVTNDVYIYVSDDVTLEEVKLERGFLEKTTTEIYKNDAVSILGTVENFWWRRPVRENLTVEIDGGPTVTGLAYIAIAVPVPIDEVQYNWNQIIVIYQDGNVRLLPLPFTSPTPGFWIPFGTSVIVGKSNPSHLRPVASIQKLLFRPRTFKMTVTYYDGSSADMALTYNSLETALTVKNMNFLGATSSLPFATFRSMFAVFGRTDSDSVQTDLESPKHVVGNWSTMTGKEFKLFRTVQSLHVTQSPDISLKIEA